MSISHIKLMVLFILPSFVCDAQDEVLFRIGSDVVTVSEFKYIYEKNNRDKADYSKESIEEYLDLYINFKLKVHKARELGYDDSDTYKKELEGYRQQLADSYVIDKEVITRMVNEIYERQKYDIEVRHIIIPSPEKSPQSQQVLAEQKINEASRQIREGMLFDIAVQQFSQDRNSARLGGDLGFIHAPLPEGYVAFEDAAYTLSPGSISEPIKTKQGYHIIQVVSKRPARGTMEAEHLLIRKNSPGGIPLAAAKVNVDKIYAEIKAGTKTFDQATIVSSEDRETKGNTGYLGFFTIGQYERSFEDAAFALKADGDISEPIETSIGWHIIRRVSRKELDTKELIRERLSNAPKQGERFDRVSRDVVNEIKKEANFKEDKSLLQEYSNKLSNDFFDYSWKLPENDDKTLLSFGSDKYDLNDFTSYAKKNSKARMRAKGQISIKKAVEELYESFVTTKAIAFAEDRLEDRYPEFKNLMREYREGILLFDIAKDMVWDKAASDTTAINDYFKDHREDYRWKDRAETTQYTVRSLEPKLITDIITNAKKSNSALLVKRYNSEKELIIFRKETLEKGHKNLAELSLEPGFVSPPVFNSKLKLTTFTKVEDVTPARLKTLKEAKGYVISDYQDHLDKIWIEELKDEYKVKIDKKRLKNLFQ